jgi:hypothetical protein
MNDMKTPEKPTTKELLDAIKILYDNQNSEQYNTYLKDLTALYWRNDEALQNNWNNGDHDRQAFDKLIKAIELNGINHFNMSTFMSSIPENWWEKYDSVSHYASFNGFNNFVEPANKQYLDNITSSFNCNTVGCVAGFATAVAMDWSSEEWLKDLPFSTRNEAFINIACNYLNIPKRIGERIFFGEEGSIWAFLATYDSSSFSEIVIESDCDEYGEEVDWEEQIVNLNTVGYKYAVEVLRMINTGEIEFDTNDYYSPYFTKERK